MSNIGIQISNKTSFHLLCSNSFQTPWISYDNASLQAISLLAIVSIDSLIVASWTGLTDPEEMKKRIDACAAAVKPEVLEDYGEKYLKNIRSFSEHVTGFCSENVDAVIDALDDAISLKYPSAVYKPCRNFLYQVIFYMGERVPSFVVHMVLRFYRIIKGFPKPREAENYL